MANLFDFVNDINYNKKGNLLDNIEDEKDFNPVLIIKILSMNLDNIKELNIANLFLQSDLSKKNIYSLLIDLVKKNTKRCNYIKNINIDNKDTEMVKEYYQCSTKEAIEYINIMGDDWVTQIKNSYGGVKNV